MDIIQIEELHILIPYSQWSSSAKEVAQILTGYSSSKIVSLFKDVIDRKALDEKLLMKLLIANKNHLPIDFLYDILSHHKREGYASFGSYRKNINLRISLLQQQFLVNSADIGCTAQVYHLVLLDEIVRQQFIEQHQTKTRFLYYTTEENFVLEIKEAITTNPVVFVIWDRVPEYKENQLIKQYDFWMKIVFSGYDEALGYCNLRITNSLEQSAMFRNLTSMMNMNGILGRYYLIDDDLNFMKDLVEKRIVPPYYQSLYSNSSIAYPTEWVSLILEKSFTVEDLDKIGILSKFISSVKLKQMLLNNDFHDIKLAFDLLSSLIFTLNNYGFENISKFFKKQKIKSFEGVITSLFLLQNKKNIINCEYISQTYISNWKNESDDKWAWIVPVSSNELFDWGYRLNNCLNNTNFHKEMMLGEQYIIIAQNKKNKKELACIRINKITGQVLEIKGINNVILDNDLLIEFNNKINHLFNKTFNVSI